MSAKLSPATPLPPRTLVIPSSTLIACTFVAVSFDMVAAAGPWIVSVRAKMPWFCPVMSDVPSPAASPSIMLPARSLPVATAK